MKLTVVQAPKVVNVVQQQQPTQISPQRIPLQTQPQVQPQITSTVQQQQQQQINKPKPTSKLANDLISSKSSVPTSASSSLLQVLKQTSPIQEKISSGGVQKNVHVIVKNAPFTVVFGLTSNVFANRVLDLNHFTFDAQLFYDTNLEKGVDYVKIKPVDFKATVNGTGNQVTLELRIKVLTTHHENSLFRVKVLLLDPTTGLPFHSSLCSFTEPIKVISKPEQLKSKRKKEIATLLENSATSPSSPDSDSSSSTGTTTTVNKKRSITDVLIETIGRIETQQREQHKLIEKLVAKEMAKKTATTEQQQQQQTSPTTANDSPSLIAVPVSNKRRIDSEEPSNAENAFENAFKKLFDAYNNLSAEDRPLKIRKVIRNSSSRDTEKITELLDLFMVEGGLQQRVVGNSNVTGNGVVVGGNGNTNALLLKPTDFGTNVIKKECQCYDGECNCPSQKDLEKLDFFYKDFLSAPLDSPYFDDEFTAHLGSSLFTFNDDNSNRSGDEQHL